jgi:hypothetical protein
MGWRLSTPQMQSTPAAICMAIRTWNHGIRLCWLGRGLERRQRWHGGERGGDNEVSMLTGKWRSTAYSFQPFVMHTGAFGTPIILDEESPSIPTPSSRPFWFQPSHGNYINHPSQCSYIIEARPGRPIHAWRTTVAWRLVTSQWAVPMAAARRCARQTGPGLPCVVLLLHARRHQQEAFF